MECSICLDAIPFLGDLTKAVEEYATRRKFRVLSLYHDEPRWIVQEPHRESEPIRTVQITLLLKNGEFVLSFVPSFYIDHKHKRTIPERIPPAYIKHAEPEPPKGEPMTEYISVLLDHAFKMATRVIKEGEAKHIEQKKRG